MQLKLFRNFKSIDYTIGKLFINGVYFCDTLEDAVRKEKIMHQTAIPAGQYKVVLSHSPRFKRIMPELLNVPGFTGIRIHSGNTKDDTSGCILVGLNKEKGKVLESRATYNRLFEVLEKAAYRGEEIYITIEE